MTVVAPRDITCQVVLLGRIGLKEWELRVLQMGMIPLVGQEEAYPQRRLVDLRSSRWGAMKLRKAKWPIAEKWSLEVSRVRERMALACEEEDVSSGCHLTSASCLPSRGIGCVHGECVVS